MQLVLFQQRWPTTDRHAYLHPVTNMKNLGIFDHLCFSFKLSLCIISYFSSLHFAANHYFHSTMRRRVSFLCLLGLPFVSPVWKASAQPDVGFTSIFDGNVVDGRPFLITWDRLSADSYSSINLTKYDRAPDGFVPSLQMLTGALHSGDLKDLSFFIVANRICRFRTTWGSRHLDTPLGSR